VPVEVRVHQLEGVDDVDGARGAAVEADGPEGTCFGGREGLRVGRNSRIAGSSGVGEADVGGGAGGVEVDVVDPAGWSGAVEFVVPVGGLDL
jgi:hypothetical protein